MTTKLFEIRDVATTMSALAVKLDGPRSEAERWLLGRAGFGTNAEDQSQYVLLLNLDGSSGTWSCDPYAWNTGARTMPMAQQFINAHFADLESGAVVDVQFVNGETAQPKMSDRFYTAAR